MKFISILGTSPDPASRGQVTCPLSFAPRALHVEQTADAPYPIRTIGRY